MQIDHRLLFQQSDTAIIFHAFIADRPGMTNGYLPCHRNQVWGLLPAIGHDFPGPIPTIPGTEDFGQEWAHAGQSLQMFRHEAQATQFAGKQVRMKLL
ncbi:MAG: hypothetical protein QM605_08915 [Sphingobium sp.]